MNTTLQTGRNGNGHAPAPDDSHAETPLPLDGQALQLTAPPATLSLSGVRDALDSRGVPIPLPQLSQLVNIPEVAALLRVGGNGQRRELHPDTVEILAAFWPAFREAKGRMPQAAGMLGAFLQARDAGEMVPAGGPGFQLSPIPKPTAETRKPDPDPVELARAQGRAQGLAAAERVLTAKQAADVMQISVRLLRQSVPPFRRFGKSAAGDRWRLSDLVSSSDLVPGGGA